MKWIIGIFAALLVLGILAVGVIYATGNGALLRLGAGIIFGAPDGKFDPNGAAAAPDYNNPANWYALPETLDLADSAPLGVDSRQPSSPAPVDVFFIHPTGFLKGSHWTSPMNSASQTEENSMWMMINQASAYSGCCNVYAPRYRQASIFAYLRAAPDERARIMRFAYDDVARAFRHYLAHHNDGRPFIIASHSQGTHHGVVLLREEIDGTALATRLVAAYLIGGGLDAAEFAGLQDIDICDSPDQLRCAIHWDTMSEQAGPDAGNANHVCVNPLNWRRNGERVPASQHAGGVPPSGRFQVDFIGDDAATGVEYPPLSAPQVNKVSARCADGVLYVTHQAGTPFDTGGSMLDDNNYHLLDYPLFYMDIRRNAELRAATYMARQAATAAGARR